MNHCPRTPILSRLTALPVLLLGALITSGAARAAAPPDADARLSALQQQLEQMQAALQQLSEENRALREHQEEVDRKLAQLGAGAAPASRRGGAGRSGRGGALRLARCRRRATAPAAVPPRHARAGCRAWQQLAASSRNLRLWGYGEVYYTDPMHDRNQAQADLARAVFGIGYRVRRAYRVQLRVRGRARGGLRRRRRRVRGRAVLRRPPPERRRRRARGAVPHALRAAQRAPRADQLLRRAAQLRRDADHPEHLARGRLQPARQHHLAALPGTRASRPASNLSEWDFAPEFPPYTNALQLEDNGIAPLQATHQELALANARNLSQYLALELLRRARG